MPRSKTPRMSTGGRKRSRVEFPGNSKYLCIDLTEDEEPQLSVDEIVDRLYAQAEEWRMTEEYAEHFLSQCLFEKDIMEEKPLELKIYAKLFIKNCPILIYADENGNLYKF
ncbi:hypothetical protein BB559_003102 [Furculomyces boomerangus]|uniref:Uncharacterized protein n=1 Tax=Furculomyces boomerangus TaxID=61424 RepID=A0A2T9YNX4_9FUNG|nr:hypothetical protein BB559_003102 [Furculomyces boomerangus]